LLSGSEQPILIMSRLISGIWYITRIPLVHSDFDDNSEHGETKDFSVSALTLDFPRGRFCLVVILYFAVNWWTYVPRGRAKLINCCMKWPVSVRNWPSGAHLRGFNRRLRGFHSHFVCVGEIVAYIAGLWRKRSDRVHCHHWGEIRLRILRNICGQNRQAFLTKNNWCLIIDLQTIDLLNLFGKYMSNCWFRFDAKFI
jgi:hypothetical protein